MCVWRAAYPNERWRDHLTNLVRSIDQCTPWIKVTLHVSTQVLDVDCLEARYTQDSTQDQAAVTIESPRQDVWIDHVVPTLHGAQAEVKVVSKVLEPVDGRIVVEIKVVGMVDAIALAR